MATGMFTQHQRVLLDTDRLRRHNLVSQSFLQHAVLMNAGFMSEGIAPDNRFVRLNLNARYGREQLTTRINLLRVNTNRIGKKIRSYLKDHYKFFQGSITGALSDAVHGAFNLARSGLNGGD